MGCTRQKWALAGLIVGKSDWSAFSLRASPASDFCSEKYVLIIFP